MPTWMFAPGFFLRSLPTGKLRSASLPLLAAAILFLSGCHKQQDSSRPPIPSNLSVKQAGDKAAPADPPSRPAQPPGGVRGIYLTGWTAGLPKRFNELMDLVDRTELNAMVIDVKDDGDITYDIDIPLAKESKANLHMIRDIDALTATAKKHHIYLIARLACFRDTPLAKSHPEMAVQTANGQVWHDRSHHSWLNPFNKGTWDYNVDIALDAIKHGFDEIQFDYVRFPSEGKISQLHYPGRPKGAERKDQIAAFLKYASEKIHARGAWLSADVFGLTSKVNKKNPDMGIGQTRTNVAEHVDFLSPMVYPSHYAHGEYHIPNPNLEPYKIIHLSVGDAQKNLVKIPTCQLRPWLQDFSLPARIHYGPAQVKAEIKALNDLGITSYLLWNARCHFTEGALQKTKATGNEPRNAASAQKGAPDIAPIAVEKRSDALPNPHGQENSNIPKGENER